MTTVHVSLQYHSQYQGKTVEYFKFVHALMNLQIENHFGLMDIFWIILLIHHFKDNMKYDILFLFWWRKGIKVPSPIQCFAFCPKLPFLRNRNPQMQPWNYFPLSCQHSINKDPIGISFRYNHPVGVLVLSVLGLVVWILGYRLIKVNIYVLKRPQLPCFSSLEQSHGQQDTDAG